MRVRNPDLQAGPGYHALPDLGRTVKGQSAAGERKPTPSPTAQPTREQRVIFAPQNMQIQGRLEGQWVETS